MEHVLLSSKPEFLLNELGAVEAAHLIALGRISSESLVRACLERIALREEAVRAWATLDADHALSQARECDRTAARGPLHGVPIAVKDVLDTQDFPTQMGSSIYAGHQSNSDASCVAMLREAGAVIFGKTTTCEFAGVAPGPTRNPLDLERTPGGSSSGSGAAVADYMIPLALGTQTGGSILRPASFCGIFGFKPTYNLVNRSGLKFAVENIDTIGLLARNLDDIKLAFGILTNRVLHQIKVAAPRIGVCYTHLWDKAQPETRSALAHATQLASAGGAVVENFDFPLRFASLENARETISSVERARSLAWENSNHSSELSPQMSSTVLRGRALSGEEYQRELGFVDECRQELDRAFERFDILLAPCVNGEAPRGLSYAGDPSFQSLWTLLHVPTLTIPIAQGPHGMPVGVQLIAKRYDDKKLLDVANWLMSEVDKEIARYPAFSASAPI